MTLVYIFLPLPYYLHYWPWPSYVDLFLKSGPQPIRDFHICWKVFCMVSLGIWAPPKPLKCKEPFGLLSFCVLILHSRGRPALCSRNPKISIHLSNLNAIVSTVPSMNEQHFLILQPPQNLLQNYYAGLLTIFSTSISKFDMGLFAFSFLYFCKRSQWPGNLEFRVA